MAAVSHLVSRMQRRAGRWGAELRTGSIALAASLAMVSIPLTGGIGQLIQRGGDTPALAAPEAGQLLGGFTWVNTVDIAEGVNAEGIWAHVPVGGISGIDCDSAGCIAISDDSGQRGPVRAYPFDPTTGHVGEPIVLTDSRGVPYPPGMVDPESIRLTHTGPPGMVWSSEGTSMVTVADRTGRALRTLPVPSGTDGNHGLEGLAVLNGAEPAVDAVSTTGGGDLIVTATELPPRGERHNLITVYRGDNAVASFSWPGTGVSEILSVGGCPGNNIGQNRRDSPLALYVLERGYTPGVGNSAVLWRTELPGLPDRSEQSQPMLSREPVVDLAAMVGMHQVGNVEALTWWPRAHGTCDLLVGTDNNFHASQRSVIHILRPNGSGKVAG